MINHVTLNVASLEQSKKFFSAALAPLGYAMLVEKPHSAGFGQADGKDGKDFWITESPITDIKSFSCLAFTAESKEAVDEFYKATLLAGGKDNGAPGYRLRYYPGYYSAY